MSDKPEAFIEAAKCIGDRCGVKPLAGQEKAYTDALLAQMREARLLSVGIPTENGGPGLSLTDIARITFEIARQDGSAGLIYAMHTSQMLCVVKHGDNDFFSALLQRIVDEQLLIASGTSEKGPGGDILTSICKVEESASGSCGIVKASPNISYINHADLILVTAMRCGADGRQRQVLVAAEVDRENFNSPFETQMLGMRGIYNASWEFSVEFQSDAIFEENFSTIARSTMTPTIQILWAALWSGMADHVLGKAREFVSTQLNVDDEATHFVRLDLTRLIGKHHTMNALISEAIRAYADGDGGQLGFALSARINRLKVECSEMLNTICHGALQIIGLRGYVLGGPFTVAQPLADALSAPIMVSNYRLSGNTMKVENYVSENL